MTRTLFIILVAMSAAPVAAKDASAQNDEARNRGDAIRVAQRSRVLQLAWSDAEDALNGVVSPPDLRQGDPVKVTLAVSSRGAPFAGPVTLDLRGDDESVGQLVTVEPEDGAWSTTFVARKSGPHWLDVSFRTSRHKVLHARLEVRESRFPGWVMWTLLAAIATLALALGVYRVLKKPTSSREPPLTT